MPALVLENTNGSALVFAQVAGGATLVWMASEDLSFHTVSNNVVEGSTEQVTYPYYGQETEVSSQDVISIETAMLALAAWFEKGVPGIPFLLWEQD